MSIFSKKNDPKDNLPIIVGKYNKLSLYVGSELASSQLETFYDRYNKAKTENFNLLAFFEAEEIFIDKLINAEKQKIVAEEARRLRKEAGYAALEKQTAYYDNLIKKYPPLNIRDSKNIELLHLFGAIDVLDRTYWASISKHLREVYPIRAKSPLELLENQLFPMIAGSPTKPPSVLAYYSDMLRRGEGENTDSIAYQAVKEAAFFINDLLDVLTKANYPTDSEAYLFVVDVIKDFRLKDIKRKKE